MALKKEIVEAIEYFLEVTGEDISQFLDSIKTVEVAPDNLDQVDYNTWLRYKVVKTIKSKGITTDELIKNKDLLMDKDVTKEDGSFYTPLDWAKKTHEQCLRHIPNLEDYVVWDASCGSGNLVAELPKCKQLYVSTLHEEDVAIVKERIPHAHAFQLDFLDGIDYSPFITEFTNRLPQGLQDALRNDDPILFLMNPPYSVTNAQKTQVSKHLRAIGESEIGNDLLRQFIWRVYNLADIHSLTQSYFACIGTNSLFIQTSWASTVRVMNEYSDYIEGFTYPASEFEGVNKSINWGIYSTLWKIREYREVDVNPRITMKEMKKDKDGVIREYDDFEYVWDKKTILQWQLEPVTEGSVKAFPRVNTRGEVKRLEDNSAVVLNGLTTSLGYYFTENSFKGITQKNGISTLPMQPSTVPITRENFTRVVSAFAFNSNFQEEFYYSSRAYLEPVTGTDEYRIWTANALYFLLCGRKSFLNSHRNVDFNGHTLDYNTQLFPFTAEQAKEWCKDPKILQDIEENPIDNAWFIQMLKDAEPYVWDEVKELYDAVTGFIKQTYNHRHSTGYALDTHAWNSGFTQLRYTNLWNANLEEKYSNLLNKARGKFRAMAKTHYVV